MTPYLTLTIALLLFSSPGLTQSTQPSGGETRVPLVFADGYNTDPRDGGRPVMLVAAALGVPVDVFREAFKGVHPARGGGGPTGDQARANKKVLLDALSKYGVINDRLDEVSNRYRYRPQNGELWPTKSAEGYAVMRGGKVAELFVTDGGYGYCSPPTITVKDLPQIKVTPVLAYGKEFEHNGSVASAKLSE